MRGERSLTKSIARSQMVIWTCFCLTLSVGPAPAQTDEPSIVQDALPKPETAGSPSSRVIKTLVIDVNAPDGPTLETSRALQQARDNELPSVTMRLKNVDLIQDDELMKLIAAELAELAAEYGYAGRQFSLIYCVDGCE